MIFFWLTTIEGEDLRKNVTRKIDILENISLMKFSWCQMTKVMGMDEPKNGG